MFSTCGDLTIIDISSFNLENVIDLSYMFQDCYNLNEIIFNESTSTKNLNSNIEKLDDNKTIVTIDGAFDSKKLEKIWHDYCVKSSFGIKCFDIHKDNPTILYVP